MDILFARRTAFKAVLLFVMAVSTVQWVHYHFSFVYRGFLVWGALIIAWDFFHDKKLWKGKTIWLLGAFCLLYAVTIFLNRETELVKNLKALAYMVILFITLYGGGAADPEERRKERKVLATELFVLLLIIALVCLALFLLGYHKTYKTPDKVIGYIGSFNSRLAGLMNSNTIGAFFSISVLLDLGLLLGKKVAKGWQKALVWVSLALSVLCLFLSYSRTSLYALAAVLGLGVFWLLPRARAFENSSFKTVLVSRILAALCVILLLTGAASPMHDLLYKTEGLLAAKAETTAAESSSAAETGSEAAMETTEAAGSSAEKKETTAATKNETASGAEKETTAAAKSETVAGASKEASAKTAAAENTAAQTKAAESSAAETEAPESTTVDKKKVLLMDGHPDGEVDAALTGRVTIWKTALVLFKEKPLFGYTNCGFADTMWEMLYGTGYGVHVRNGGLHNIYFEIMLSSGTAGAVCIAVFGVMCLIMVLKRRKTWIREAEPSTAVLLLLVLFFLIAELMESRIMYRTGFFMVFFWMAAGMLKEDMMGIRS